MKQNYEKIFLDKFQELTEDELLQIDGGGKHAEALYGGALTGASLGAYLGPWGALGGAAVGGVAGVIGSYL